MADELLSVHHISKSFAGVQALQDVSFSIGEGEIRCMAGENGSGKSTLIKIIAGVYTADQGEIQVRGKRYTRLHPIEAIRAGIQVIYQDFSLFPNLTVAENIALNTQLAENKRLVNWKEIHEIAQHALEQIDVRLDLNALVEQMSVADRQLIAISRALLQNAQLIIMDEPTTSLTQKEVRSLFEVIRNLQERGISILFVSHKLHEVLEISEKIMILRNGKMVVEGDREDFDQAKITYHMTGHHVDTGAYDYTPQPEADTPLLKVANLSLENSFSDISFELMPGEILGIAGLLGSGRSELAHALFGSSPADSGSITIDGQPVTIRSIQDAIHHGIGYVPEDRLNQGLFLDRSIGNNIIIRTIDEVVGPTGLIDVKEKKRRVNRWVDQLRIKTPTPALPAKSLSGGNQQRVVLAKWLAASPRILILNGPTVGVDIGSKAELHELIRNLAHEGMGLLIISDEVPELLQTCNRILLMRKGRIVDHFLTGEISENQLSEKLREPAA